MTITAVILGGALGLVLLGRHAHAECPPSEPTEDAWVFLRVTSTEPGTTPLNEHHIELVRAFASGSERLDAARCAPPVAIERSWIDGGFESLLPLRIPGASTSTTNRAIACTVTLSGPSQTLVLVPDEHTPELRSRSITVDWQAITWSQDPEGRCVADLPERVTFVERLPALKAPNPGRPQPSATELGLSAPRIPEAYCIPMRTSAPTIALPAERHERIVISRDREPIALPAGTLLSRCEFTGGAKAAPFQTVITPRGQWLALAENEPVTHTAGAGAYPIERPFGGYRLCHRPVWVTRMARTPHVTPEGTPEEWEVGSEVRVHRIVEGWAVVVPASGSAHARLLSADHLRVPHAFEIGRPELRDLDDPGCEWTRVRPAAVRGDAAVIPLDDSMEPTFEDDFPAVPEGTTLPVSVRADGALQEVDAVVGRRHVLASWLGRHVAIEAELLGVAEPDMTLVVEIPAAEIPLEVVGHNYGLGLALVTRHATSEDGGSALGIVTRVLRRSSGVGLDAGLGFTQSALGARARLDVGVATSLPVFAPSPIAVRLQIGALLETALQGEPHRFVGLGVMAGLDLPHTSGALWLRIGGALGLGLHGAPALSGAVNVELGVEVLAL